MHEVHEMTDLDAAVKQALIDMGVERPDPPPPDTTPRNSLTNRRVPITIKGSWSNPSDNEHHYLPDHKPSPNPFR
jgi:hypothetical protein